MGLKPGHPKYGGRKKGVPNKRSELVADKAAALGIDPFEILLLFSRGDWKSLGYDSEKDVVGVSKFGEPIVKRVISPELRAGMAADACQYLHPKRKAIELTGADGGPVVTQTQIDTSNLSDEELAVLEKALSRESQKLKD